MSNWRTTFDRISGRGNRVRAFLRWWGGALATWLPAGWRRVLGLQPDRLLATLVNEQLQLQRQSGDQLTELAVVPLPLSPIELERLLSPTLARLPRWLVLAPHQVLRRELSLPVGASDLLRDVVGFEIDRQTPFSAHQVEYDARHLGSIGDTQLRAELVVVPKIQLEQSLQALGELASGLSGVDVAQANGVTLAVNLLPSTQRTQKVDPQRRLNLMLAGVALLALVLTGMQTLHNRRAAADTLEQSVNAQAERARAVARQRQQLQDLVEGQAFLDQKRAAQPAMIEVLDDIAKRLPDDSYLEKLAVEGEQLSLIGLSANASALVSRLEGSPAWNKPALTGALQTDPLTRRDRFTLSAQLATTAAPTSPQTAAADDTRLP